MFNLDVILRFVVLELMMVVGIIVVVYVIVIMVNFINW